MEEERFSRYSKVMRLIASSIPRRGQRKEYTGWNVEMALARIWDTLSIEI